MSPIGMLLVAVVVLLVILTGVCIAILSQVRKTRDAAEEAAAHAHSVLSGGPGGSPGDLERFETLARQMASSVHQIGLQAGHAAGENVAAAVLEHLGYDPGRPALSAHAYVGPEPAYEGVPHAGQQDGYPYNMQGGHPDQTDWQSGPSAEASHPQHMHDRPVITDRGDAPLITALTQGGARPEGSPPPGYRRVEVTGDTWTDQGYATAAPPAFAHEQQGAPGGNTSNAQTLTMPRVVADDFDALVRQPGESEQDYQARRLRDQQAFQAQLDRSRDDVTGGFRRMADGSLAPM